MSEKRKKIRFLMKVLGDQYWDVDIMTRLSRLRLLISAIPRRYDHRLEVMNYD